MNDATKAMIFAHANREAPREACGLLLNVRGKERYLPCKNIAQNQTDFIMCPEDYAAAEELGDILAVVHSHPVTSAKPSQADLVACEWSGLPWIILSLPTLTWERIEPSGYKAPIVGRKYAFGVLDCYTLIQDWYRENRGVELPHLEREEDFWKKGQNLYIDNFQAFGFVRVPLVGIQPGDLACMRLQSEIINHGAVYVGRNQILHHVNKRLSTREVFDGYWRKSTQMVLRYQGATP